MFSMNSDSTGTTTMSFSASALDDETCGGKSTTTLAALVDDRSTHTGAVSKPVRIAAGKDFAFFAAYTETRFGETRYCALIGSFSPVAHRKYLARLAVTGEGSSCTVNIRDVSGSIDEPVAVHFPATLCNGRPNPTSVRKKIRISVGQ